MNEALVKRAPVLELEALILFLVGAIIVAFIVVVTSTVTPLRFLFEAHTFGPASEEVFKFLAACSFISLANFNFLPLPFLGAGFGIVEAARHFEVYGAIGVWPILTHFALGIVMSFFLYQAGRARTLPQKVLLYALALSVPIALHLFYNNIIVHDFLL